MAGDIEFLDTEPPTGPVDAPPASRSRSAAGPPTRRRTAVYLAAGALVAGALIARAATSGTDAPVAVPRSPASQLPSNTSVVLDPATGDVLQSGTVTYCYDVVQIPVRPIPLPMGSSGGSPSIRVQVPGPDTGPRVPTNEFPQGTATTCVKTRSDACPPTGPSSKRKPGCSTTEEVPVAFVQAVRRLYPGARIASARTQVLLRTHRVWARSVLLIQGHSSIRIVVLQHGKDLGYTGSRDNGSTVVTRAVVHTSTTSVVVEVTTPSGSKTDVGRVRRLASNAALDAAG